MMRCPRAPECGHFFSCRVCIGMACDIVCSEIERRKSVPSSTVDLISKDKTKCRDRYVQTIREETMRHAREIDGTVYCIQVWCVKKMEAEEGSINVASWLSESGLESTLKVKIEHHVDSCSTNLVKLSRAPLVLRAKTKYNIFDKKTMKSAVESSGPGGILLTDLFSEYERACFDISDMDSSIAIVGKRAYARTIASRPNHWLRNVMGITE